MNDHEILRRFVEGNDEGAFTELVSRHVHVVYSTAYRILRNAHLAEEVAQDAFCLLARKANRLAPSTVLVAWLHRTTWHLAMKALRGELRRHAREELASMSPMNTSDQESLWNQIAPLLDQAIESLNQTERRAVLLRFFERKPAREIGTALGVTEEAARMRVSRGVEKLRSFFSRRGVTCGSAALVALLTSKAVEAAPAASIHIVEVAARLATRSLLSPSLGIQLITLMAQIKLKTAVITGMALLLALLTAHQIRHTIRNSAAAQPPALAGRTPDQIPAPSGRGLAGFFSRTARPANPTEAAELAALDQLREILYSPESDIGLPPEGMAAAVAASGSKRRAALDLMLEALKSNDAKAQHRAVAGLQLFREAADELVPELMTILKTSQDAALVQYASMPLWVFRPDAEMIPALIDALKQNPLASECLKGWFGTYFFSHKIDPSELAKVIPQLLPLLDSEKSDERRLAALLLARTSVKDDPRLISTLIPVLQEANSQDGGSAHQRSVEALQALKRIGQPAGSAADAIQEFGRKMPGMRELVIDALAATSPDLRTEIPELDAKLRAREEALAFEERGKRNETSVPALLGALQNSEARMRAVEKLGGLGSQAAEALPRLREILKSGDSDSRSDANNYLFAVATAIRQIDPTEPTYYRPEELLPAFMDATRDLKAIGDDPSGTLREQVEGRMFSARPFDWNEIVAWIEKLKGADPEIGRAFVHKIKRSPSLSQLEISDPAFAKALTP